MTNDDLIPVEGAPGLAVRRTADTPTADGLSPAELLRRDPATGEWVHVESVYLRLDRQGE